MNIEFKIGRADGGIFDTVTFDPGNRDEVLAAMGKISYYCVEAGYKIVEAGYSECNGDDN